MTETFYKVDFGCRINTHFHADILKDLIEDHSDTLPKHLRYEDLEPDKQNNFLRAIFRDCLEKSMVFNIEEISQEELRNRNAEILERQIEEKSLEKSEYVQRVMKATKPEHREYMSKILKGFPDLEQIRQASTGAKDNFSNALIRMALHKLFNIIEDNKISMKVANNLFNHVMTETSEAFGFGLKTRKVDSHIRMHYARKINSLFLTKFHFTDAEFDSFWKANMCSTIYQLITSWDMDRMANDGMFDPLDLEYSAAQESYIMPRTKLGLEFCQTFARHCRPSLITAYYTNPDVPTVTMNGENCKTNHGLVAKDSLATDSPVTVEELSRVLSS